MGLARNLIGKLLFAKVGWHGKQARSPKRGNARVTEFDGAKVDRWADKERLSMRAGMHVVFPEVTALVSSCRVLYESGFDSRVEWSRHWVILREGAHLSAKARVDVGSRF